MEKIIYEGIELQAEASYFGRCLLSRRTLREAPDYKVLERCEFPDHSFQRFAPSGRRYRVEVTRISAYGVSWKPNCKWGWERELDIKKEGIR